MKIHRQNHRLIATLLLAWTLSPAAATAQYVSHHGPNGPHPGPPQVDWGSEIEAGPIAGECQTCPDCQCNDCCCSPGKFTAGYGFVFLQPHFENDVAFYSNTTNQSTFSTTGATNFNYDLELTPRVWLEYDRASGLGYRAAYWQFRHAAPTRIGTHSEAEDDGDTIINSHFTPQFGGFSLDEDPIQFFTDEPGQTLATQTGLNLYTIDLEGTKWVKFDCWALLATAGFRFGSVRQLYRARLDDVDETELGALEFLHRFSGIGPTFSMEARRPVGSFTLFGQGRASILFGNGNVRFTAREQFGQTEDDVFNTDYSFARNDVLTIGELQVGAEYCRTCCGWECYVRTALEAQVWQGAGSPTGEEGDLGLFGFSVSLGMNL